MTMPKLERPNMNEKGAGLLWHPLAKIHKLRMKTHGKYAGGYPRGAIVHFTAGNRPGSLDWGIAQGYCYLMIDGQGTIQQAHPIDEYGWHAGASAYPGLKGSVSDELVGIEIASAGKLEKVVVAGQNRYKAWFHKSSGEYFFDQDVRFSQARANIIEGWYHKYTEAQEATLISLLKWLKHNDPTGQFSFDFVLGHDEVASPHGRKQDPGASLSMTMPELRKLLKASL